MEESLEIFIQRFLKKIQCLKVVKIKYTCLNVAIFKSLILRGQIHNCLKHLQLTITGFNTRIGKHMSENLSTSAKHKLGQHRLAFLIQAVISGKIAGLMQE